MRTTATYATIALLLSAGVGTLARRIDPREAGMFDVAYVPSSGAMRWLSLGHPTLLANLHWLRAVQYLGEPRADQRGWEKLRPLAELVTDLDPRHGYAYQVTGNRLASAGLVADSNAIFEKGMRNVPTRYILPFHRAVNAFLYEGDYALAGRFFEKAAATPGAPPHLRDYVVAMYVKGDEAGAAISFLQHLRAEAEDEETRRAVDKQLAQAYLERDAAVVERAAAQFRARHGFPAIAIAQLRADGVLPVVPRDPFGGEFYLDRDQRVRSTVNTKRFERPRTDLASESRARLRAMEPHLP